MAEPLIDGALFVWTGSATGAALDFVRQTRFAPAWGWRDDAALDGTVRHHLTGQRVDMAFEVAYTLDAAQRLGRLAQSATGAHFLFRASGIEGSAGYIAYSGRFDGLTLAGGSALILSAHAPRWSAFG